MSEPRPHFTNGFSLIEVLAALTIMSFCILGVFSMQNRGLHSNQESLHKSRADMLAWDLIDRIRANPTGNYAFSGSGPNGGCTSCDTPNEIAQQDLFEWWGHITSSKIPEATAHVIRHSLSDDIHRYTVVLQWAPKLPTSSSWDSSICQDDDSDRACYAIEAIL